MAEGTGIEPATLSSDCFQDSVLVHSDPFLIVMVAGVGIEPTLFLVMSQASSARTISWHVCGTPTWIWTKNLRYIRPLLRPIELLEFMVPQTGIEPACFTLRVLSPPCLPFHHWGNGWRGRIRTYGLLGQSQLICH